VSASNSLIGTTTGDLVGSTGAIALSNGNYVVVSDHWNNGVAGSQYGAATWGNGSSGIAGPVHMAVVAVSSELVSPLNSLLTGKITGKNIGFGVNHRHPNPLNPSRRAACRASE
jgi:Repeat of unknown function (DUF5650)